MSITSLSYLSRRLSFALLGTLAITSSWAAPPPEYAQEKAAFIQEMVEKHAMDRAFVAGIVDQAVYQQKIIDAITRPAEGKAWRDYRPIFLTPGRINGGVEFWQQHAKILERAERTYGVPPEIVVAIIGVETRYGGYTGSYRVIDALTTLGFGYPKRAAFFRGELEAFLQLINEQPIDPLAAKGSYAGAMGLPQFIPTSYRAYAVDFDDDGVIDLLSNLQDAIGSVAAYLHRHGWQRDGSITSRALGASSAHSEQVGAGMKPSFTLKELAQLGIRPAQDKVKTALASLLELEGDQGAEYWLGFDNFYAITRYNRSNLYAMAVVQLSEAIRQGYALQPAFDFGKPQR